MPAYPETRIIYTRLTDHINNYKYYLIDIPDTTRRLTAYELDPTTGGPFFTPMSGEVGAGMFTINWMINAYHDRTPFTFGRRCDICHVAWKLGDYVEVLKKHEAKLDKEGKEYLQKAVEFLAVMDKNADRYLRKTGKEALVKEARGDTFFDEFMSARKKSIESSVSTPTTCKMGGFRGMRGLR